MREWKSASTRVRLAAALLDQIPQRNVTEIPVQSLCDAVSVSNATFFNYFPRKADLVVYLTQLIQIDIAYHARQRSDGSALRGIEAQFARTAELMVSHPWGMHEIIAAQALLREPPRLPQISPAERAAAFPGADVEDIPTGELLRDAFARQLAVGVELSELPPDADVDAAATLLHCIYFGVPFGTWLGPDEIGPQYQRQLDRLWSDLGGERIPKASRIRDGAPAAASQRVQGRAS